MVLHQFKMLCIKRPKSTYTFSLQRWYHCSVILEFYHILRKTYCFSILDFWSGQCVRLDLKNWWPVALKGLKIVIGGLQITFFFFWMGRNLYGLWKNKQLLFWFSFLWCISCIQFVFINCDLYLNTLFLGFVIGILEISWILINKYSTHS